MISSNIDAVLQRYPSVEVAAFGDFNVHNVFPSRSKDSSGSGSLKFWNQEFEADGRVQLECMIVMETLAT